MAKAQKTSDDFNGMLMASDLRLFHKSISAMAMIKYTNHVLHESGQYCLSDYISQTISKNAALKQRLWREFWGILGKKINSTTGLVFQSDKASLKFEILILLKCTFNTFLSNELGLKEIPRGKNPLIPAIWHRIGHTQKSFRIKKFITQPFNL